MTDHPNAVQDAREAVMQAIAEACRRCGATTARVDSLESSVLDEYEAAVRQEERDNSLRWLSEEITADFSAACDWPLDRIVAARQALRAESRASRPADEPKPVEGWVCRCHTFHTFSDRLCTRCWYEWQPGMSTPTPYIHPQRHADKEARRLADALRGSIQMLAMNGKKCVELLPDFARDLLQAMERVIESPRPGARAERYAELLTRRSPHDGPFTVRPLYASLIVAPQEQAVARLAKAIDCPSVRDLSKIADNVEAMRAAYGKMCDRLQACAQKYKLGLGGEQVDELVVSEIERLYAAPRPAVSEDTKNG